MRLAGELHIPAWYEPRQGRVWTLVGVDMRKANAIPAVQDVETFARAASGRFLGRTLCDPLRAGVGQLDEGLAEKGELSLGGRCWRGRFNVVDLGPYTTSAQNVWEKAISSVASGMLVV